VTEASDARVEVPWSSASILASAAIRFSIGGCVEKMLKSAFLALAGKM
jgi:hypothetical protein